MSDGTLRMSLAADLHALTHRTLMELDATHDYYTYSKRAWRLIRQIVNEGRKFTFRNLTTGTAVDEQSLMGRVQHYTAEYLISSTLQQFVSLFEDFVFGLLRLWLTAYPKSLSKRQVEMGTVLKALDKSEIVQFVVDKELNELKYERLADWFTYLDRLVRLGCPTPDEIEQLAEIKATRDLLVHHSGSANATYLAKAGRRARFQVGETVEISEQYHRASWEMIRKVIQDVSTAAIAKSGQDRQE